MDKVLQEEAEKKSFHQNFNRSKRNFLFFKKNRFESKNPLKSNFFPEKFCMPHCKLTISRKKSFHFLLTHPSSNSALLHCASSSCRISKIQSAFLTKRIKVVFEKFFFNENNKVVSKNSDKVLSSCSLSHHH